ncbi:hypothetical protein BZA05DRAFT_393943 [Tricharina praecox]|uniref:uncharacterized protein n=1 Tax=Tricharina praecox TaxID=43433 RepID=UPI00221EB567|nr:uncharacterized protein BZA05DRAFT_393943 [Tricharina praecox]KAI5854344.1 hypothetical protein BZA05DRAFT_393943 [Tricharina praecox]
MRVCLCVCLCVCFCFLSVQGCRLVDLVRLHLGGAGGHYMAGCGCGFAGLDWVCGAGLGVRAGLACGLDRA